MRGFSQPAYVFISLVLIIGALYAGWIFFRDRRRRFLRKLPLKPEWRDFLEKNLEIYHRLPAALQEELHGHIQVFLHEKSFEGCGGLELTDEIRITIAAQACLLLLNRKTNYYPKLVSILVYPSTFIVKDQRDGQGVVIPAQGRLGESWRTGIVILAWDEVVSGAHILMMGIMLSSTNLLISLIRRTAKRMALRSLRSAPNICPGRGY